jgi:hypothetical protein
MLTIPHTISTSPIAGLGIFATGLIPKGTLVWKNFTDSEMIISQTTFEGLSDYMKQNFKHYGYFDKLSQEWKLPLDNSRFMNHSDQFNLIQDENGNSIAGRDIQAGEEITCDYRGFVNITDYDFL